MIKAFDMVLSGSNFSIKKVSPITTNAKSQYYAEVMAEDIWKERTVTITFNGVGAVVADGICILPQITAENVVIGVLSVGTNDLYNMVNKTFTALPGTNSASADVPTTSEWETYTLEMTAAVATIKSYADNPWKEGDNGNWYKWDGTEYVDSGVPVPSSGTDVTYGDGLKLEDKVLSVDVVEDAYEDNTKPITSGAVYREIGNIDALLESI